MSGIRVCLIILFAMAGCQASYTVTPRFQWNYPKGLYDDRWVDSNVIEPLAKCCTQVVQETFDIDGYSIKINKVNRFSAVMEWADGVVNIDIYAGSRVNAWHLITFIYHLTHELTEWTLSVESLHGGSIYYKDLSNRTIVEGIANFMATRAFIRARNNGFPILDKPILGMDHPNAVVLKTSLNHGIETVQLTGWKLSLDTEVNERNSLLLSVRYACSEYLVAQWVEAAKRRGIERPLRALWEWLSAHPGPTYDELTGWMERCSGLPVRKMAEAVSVREAYEYYKSLNERLRTVPSRSSGTSFPQSQSWKRNPSRM